VKHRAALFLLGGGAAGAMYQIGALAALEDSIEGLDLNEFSLFLGASSGATVAAALAGGSEVRRIYRAFLDPGDVYFPLERKHILKMDLAEWSRAGSAVLAAVRDGVMSALSRVPEATPADLWEELARLYDSLPAGFFSLERYERFFADRLARRGIGNSFLTLRVPLRVIAHDLDRGEPIVFGAPGQMHVPLTRACVASMALPPFFSPVNINGRQCINAGAAQVRLLREIEGAGVQTLVIVNPMVPVRTNSVPTGYGERFSLREKGAMWVANQAHRISLHELLRGEIQKLERELGIEVILIEPDSTDTLLFMYNPASFAARRAILEQAYRHTRDKLAAWPMERWAKLQLGRPRPSLLPQTLELGS
jgi:NTE family protein